MKQPVRLLEAASHILLAFLIVQTPTAAADAVSAPTPPPLALYGQLPSLAEPALSPAGDRLAFLESQNGRRYIVIFDLAKGKPVALAHADSAKVRSLRWFDDNQLLILYSTTSYPPFEVTGERQEWFMLGTWNVATNRMRRIDMHDDNYQTMNSVTGAIDVRVVDGDPQLFVSGTYLDQSDFYPGLFRIDLQHGMTTLIARGTTLGADWAVDAQGRIAASYDYQVRGHAEGQWVLRLRSGREMRQVAAGTADYDRLISSASAMTINPCSSRSTRLRGGSGSHCTSRTTLGALRSTPATRSSV